MKLIIKKDYQLSEKSYKLGYTEETVFHFQINKLYEVYGICIWHDTINYLLIEQEGSLPSWYPAEIFDISDPSLPSEWYFNFYGYDDISGLTAVWGYKDLVESKEHYTGLLERESQDIKTFLQMKKEIWG